MVNFTLDDLKDFTQNENKMVEQVLTVSLAGDDKEPSEECINNILNYSKALSVRKSDSGKQFKVILN